MSSPQPMSHRRALGAKGGEAWQPVRTGRANLSGTSSAREVTAVSVECICEDCNETTELGFFDKAPWGSMTIRHEGWMVLPGEEFGEWLFVCPECAKPTPEELIEILKNERESHPE